MPLGDRARTVALRPLPWKLESPRASRGGVRRGGSRFVNRAAEQDSRADAAPAQRFGTDGIKPMGRPSLVTRAFMRVVAFEHEASNRTPHTRVVLFVDFRKPLRFPANVLNWLLLNLAVFTPFIREGMDNQKA